MPLTLTMSTHNWNSSCHICESTNNPKPVSKTLISIPSAIQIHRWVPLSNAKILKETKNQLYEMLWRYKAVISKCVSDIGQTDLIKMHIARKPNAAPVVAQPYCLALKHHDIFIRTLAFSLWQNIPVVTYCYHNAFINLMKCSIEHESLSINNWYVLSKRKSQCSNNNNTTEW